MCFNIPTAPTTPAATAACFFILIYTSQPENVTINLRIILVLFLPLNCIISSWLYLKIKSRKNGKANKQMTVAENNKCHKFIKTDAYILKRSI